MSPSAPFSPFPSNFRLASPSTPLLFKQALQEAEKTRRSFAARQQLSFADKTEEAVGSKDAEIAQ
jgi:hypothetical protein